MTKGQEEELVRVVSRLVLDVTRIARAVEELARASGAKIGA